MMIGNKRADKSFIGLCNRFDLTISHRYKLGINIIKSVVNWALAVKKKLKLRLLNPFHGTEYFHILQLPFFLWMFLIDYCCKELDKFNKGTDQQISYSIYGTKYKSLILKFDKYLPVGDAVNAAVYTTWSPRDVRTPFGICIL